MEAEQGARGFPKGRGAVSGHAGRAHQALEAAPADPDREQFEPVQHRRHGLFRAGRERDPEQPRGAGEIAAPQRMARIAGQRRVEHPRDLRAVPKPSRDLERALVMPRHAQCQRPQAAQREIDVVGRGGVAEIVRGPAQRFVVLLAAHDHAQHGVGVADDILGRRLDRHVDPVREGLEVERRGPGVVEQHHQAGAVGGGGDGGHVLDLEGDRAGRLQVDQAGVRTDQLGDSRADQRVEVADFDPEAPEQLVADAARRLVDRVGDQDLVAGAQEGQQRAGDGGQPGGHGDRAVAAFELGHGAFQGEGRRHAVAAIEQGAFVEFGRSRGLELGDAVEGQGGGVVHGRIDRVVLARRVAPQAGHQSFRRKFGICRHRSLAPAPRCRRHRPWFTRCFPSGPAIRARPRQDRGKIGLGSGRLGAAGHAAPGGAAWRQFRLRRRFRAVFGNSTRGTAGENFDRTSRALLPFHRRMLQMLAS